MDKGLKKYRKFLMKLQNFCSESKRSMIKEYFNGKKITRSYLTPDRYHREKVLTDFERGYLVGRHAAFNDVNREIHEMLESSESDWNYFK